MANSVYKSSYTGAQIDSAISKIINTNVEEIATQATSAAIRAEKAANSIPEFPKITSADEGKLLGVKGGKYALVNNGGSSSGGANSEPFVIDYPNLPSDMTRQTAVLLNFDKSVVIKDGDYFVHVDELRCKCQSTVQFLLCRIESSDTDDSALLMVEKIMGMGEPNAEGIVSVLVNEDIYLDKFVILACSVNNDIECNSAPGIPVKGFPNFADRNYFNSSYGTVISCSLANSEDFYMAMYYMSGAYVSNEDYSDIEDRLERLEATVTAVDLSRFDSDGIIEETYSDGSRVTYEMEFDGNGNPTKITDSNGNETVLTW